MAGKAFSGFIQLLRRAAARNSQEESADADLLARFVEKRDEAAFEDLVRRHGPMVWSVCRRFLYQSEDAEDAFQATFLVLVRKASSIQHGSLLSNWLYGVAYRVANRARVGAARLRARETNGVDIQVSAPQTDSASEWQPAVHEEVFRLPEKYRLPIILCYLEGRTSEQAACDLGWPVGTVKGRLGRAREMLRSRLTRRGLALSTGGLGAALSGSSAGAAPPILLKTTMDGAWRYAAGQMAGPVSTQAVTLSKGVIHAMFWNKIAVAAKGLALAALIGLGAGLSLFQSFAGEKEAPPARPVQVAAKDTPQAPKEQPATAEERKASRDNMKVLALAMHGYLSDNGSFPPAAAFDKDGKPLLSWRVLLLPFFGEKDLFRQFKLDEPWDSPNNKKLLAKMPKVYAPVRGKGKAPHTTFYQVFTGNKTIFEGTRGSRIVDISDGTSNTILLIEAGESVPWTKPLDLVFDEKKPLPELGGMFPDGFYFARADGSAGFCPRKFNEAVMRLMIMRNDGMPIVGNLDD
jgi:RNA polymerase sigma factor (sigma-70 family)